MTIPELRQHVARLSPDGPHTEALQHALRARFKKRDVWYRTQKEHWTGWLRNYDGPGFYGRLRWDRDAQFVYNHIQCAPMLLWLAEAAGVPLAKVTEASKAALAAGPRLSSQVRALRKIIPWSLIEAGLKAEPTSPTSDASPTQGKGTEQKKMPRKEDAQKMLRVIKGRSFTLGTELEFKLAAGEIMGFTGGSSLGGAMSMLWGFLDWPETRVSVDLAEQLAREATEFKNLFGANLSPRANQLLDRLTLLAKTTAA